MHNKRCIGVHVNSTTLIDNAFDAGLLGLNTSITARNLLIANCGKNLQLGGGGTYNFTHCTVAAFSNNYIQHKSPVVLLTNYTAQGNVLTAAPLTATFINCIFWGEQNGFVANEVVMDTRGLTPSINFNKVLWRMQSTPAFAGLTVNGAINAAPQFDSISTQQRFYNFRLKDGSPAVNAGINTAIAIDLDGAARPVGLPDLGAYERR